MLLSGINVKELIIDVFRNKALEKSNVIKAVLRLNKYTDQLLSVIDINDFDLFIQHLSSKHTPKKSLQSLYKKGLLNNVLSMEDKFKVLESDLIFLYATNNDLYNLKTFNLTPSVNKDIYIHLMYNVLEAGAEVVFDYLLELGYNINYNRGILLRSLIYNIQYDRVYILLNRNVNLKYLTYRELNKLRKDPNAKELTKLLIRERPF